MWSRSWLWLCWLLLAFGALNLYGPPPEDRSRQDVSANAGEPSKLKSEFDAFLTLQRGGRDAERYFAYASALLGRPYAAQYVSLTEDARGVATPVGDRLVQTARPLLPWRDFAVEYPPGMLLLAVVPALFTANFETYFLLFSVEMEVMLTIAVALAVRTADALTPGAGRRALGLSIALTLALGCISVRRYDAGVALTIAAAVYGMATRRPIFAAVFLALGVALKGAPLLMAPVMLFWFASRRDWRGLALGAASGTLCLAAAGVAYLSVAGPHAIDAFAYHVDRPLQIETLYGGALMLLEPFSSHLVSLTYSYGSHNVASAAEPWLRRAAGGLEIAALLAVYATSYFRIRDAADDRNRLLAVVWAASACFVAFMSVGKVFSAQYLAWLLPLGAVAGAATAGRSWRRLLLANALTQTDYPFLYDFIINTFPALAPLLGAIVAARTLALWSWIATLFGERATALPPPSDPQRQRGE